MTRHDIRIRRGQYGANRIQRHKDYSQLLNRHRKTNRLRSVIFIILLLVVILLVVGLGYFSITNQENKTKEPQTPTSLRLSQPADLKNNHKKLLHQDNSHLVLDKF